MTNVRNLILRSALAATVVVLGANSTAWADPLEDFTIKPSVFGGPATDVVADKMTGNYNERLTVLTFDGTDGTFATEAYWDVGQFVTDDGTTAIAAKTTGLGVDYALYALFSSTGSFKKNAGGGFDFKGGPGSGSVTLYLDQKIDSSPKVVPGSAPGAVTVPNTGDDAILATATLLSGEGKTTSTPCTACGDFGLVFNPFSLTALGATYFIAPVPFYIQAVLKGQFNSFDPTLANQTANGSADAFFQAVPEPATLALLGVGLVTAMAVRRRQMAKLS